MNYRQKRNGKGLRIYTVAKELGVDFNKYVEVERGVRALEDEYVDKFQKILNNATEIKLNAQSKMLKIKEEFTDGTIRKRIKEYGYSFKEIGEKLKLSQGTISNAMTCNMDITSEDTMERIYDFIHNPFNKKVASVQMNNEQTDSEENNVVVDTNVSSNFEIDFAPNRERLELKKAIFAKGYSITEFAKLIGTSEVHLSNVINGRRNASKKVQNKIMELLNDKETETIESNEPVETVPVDTTWIEVEPTQEIENNIDTHETKEEDIIKELTLENERLKKQIDAYVKLIERLQ